MYIIDKKSSSYTKSNKEIKKIFPNNVDAIFFQATGLHHLYVAEIVGPNASFCGSAIRVCRSHTDPNN